ncbi:MAG: glycosyltransferase [Alphaproteobacteria bacterium]|nr:glycosyltransferase [Alphaproteobacteria bacterium]
MGPELWPWLAVPGGALALGVATINLLSWPRGTPDGRLAERVSVLIPARNEIATIERCVRSAAASAHPLHEIVVYDDGSTDGTSERLAALSEELPLLRVVQGSGLPQGWVGKPHACHQLSRHAQGDLLLFVDADTFLSPEGVGRLASLFQRHGADLVSAVPHQITGSFAERVMLPLLHLTYSAWLPQALVWWSSDPRFLAANGQILAVRRAAYEAVGGFEAVRQEVVDDMAFCRLVKRSGRRVVFADGEHIARCRMYEDARSIWEGFSKNLYEGIGEHPAALLGVAALYTAAFVLPYVVLLIGLTGNPTALLAGGLGVGINLTLRGMLALRHGHPWSSVLLHPLAVLMLLAIGVNSWRWSRRGQIRWAGRVYTQRALREGGHGG